MIRSTQSTVKALPERLRISIGGHFGPCYSVTLKKGRHLYLLVVARLVFPGTGTATATATRGDTAFGQAVAEFPEDAQPPQRLVLAR